MKKIFALVLALCFLLLAGCGSEADGKLAYLEEQMLLLQDRVSALEAENAQLRLQLNELANQKVELPQIEEYDPIAELMPYDWQYEAQTLTIDGAFARVMALGPNQAADSCRLLLYRNDMLLVSRSLTLLPGEASNSLELELEPMVFDLSSLADGDILTMELEVVLSDGTQLQAQGGSWEVAEGNLMMIAG